MKQGGIGKQIFPIIIEELSEHGSTTEKQGGSNRASTLLRASSSIG